MDNNLVNSYLATDYACMLCNSILYNSLNNEFNTLISNKLIDPLAIRVFEYASKFNSKSSTMKIQNLFAHWDNSIPTNTFDELSKKIRYYTELDNFTEIQKLGTIINSYLNRTLFKHYVTEFSNNKDIDKLLNNVKQLRLKAINSLPIINLGDIDSDKLNELTDETNLIPSCFDFINETMDTGAYIKGTLVCVAAAPGKGKTNFLIQEIFHKVKVLKKKVYWLAMGDMMEIDFVSRFGALFHNVSQREVMTNIMKYYTPELKEFLSNIHTSILPSATLSSSEFVDSLEDRIEKMGEDKYDIVVVDYDANFSDTDEVGSMYGAHKYIYNNLVQLAKNNPRKLIFVASQIKPQYHNEFIIPQDALAESSYKQNIIDVLITVSRDTKEVYNQYLNERTIVNYGYINLAKLRRGSGRYSGYISNNSGYLELKTKEEIQMIIGAESR